MHVKGSVVLALGSAVVLWSSPAAADGVYFDIIPECVEGSAETRLQLRCSVEVGCVEQGMRLHGCTDGCDESDLIGEGLFFTDVECECHCMIHGGTFACDATPVCEPGDYWKCDRRAWTTLDRPCEELQYDIVCLEPSCPGDHQLTVGACWDSHCNVYCAYLFPGEGGIDLCPAIHSGGHADFPGCSAATLPVGTANLAVLALLGLILALSLLAARRSKRRSTRGP